MNYGILVAVSEGGDFQIIGSVDSREEANQMVGEYLSIGPSAGFLAPWEFQIHRRSRGGAFTTIDHLSFMNGEWKP